MSDSSFLNSLIGKPVWIVCRDPVASASAPLVLKEVSALGLVADDTHRSHFFAWAEVVEVASADSTTESEASVLACFSDGE
jgi:hypothetical protein